MTEQPRENWYRLSAEAALEQFDAQRDGLSEQEAEQRLEQYGRNSIRTETGVSAWRVLIDQFTSPMIYVLMAALVVTLAIQSWADAIVIALVLVINATIGFIQEYRAESAVQSLMEMVSPQASVRRDGQTASVDAETLVPGDVVLLEQGSMVPADVRLLETGSLQVNEAALTGESVPASKTEEAMPEAEDALPPADQRNMAFMGTAVTAGSAAGVVVATGQRTQLGRIAEDIREAGEIETPLQRRMDRLAKWIAAVVLVLAAVAFGIGLWMGRSVQEMFLLAVSLSVAAIPAGLPVVMTVALAIGVRRMARQHAVIRHLPAVETLGSTTAIVSDKTGTLTQNRMTVKQVHAAERTYAISGESGSREGQLELDGEAVDPQPGSALYLALLAGLLNNEARLAEDGSVEGDPMEAALLLSAAKAGMSRQELQQRYPQIDQVPFRTEQRFSATVHEVPDDESGPLVLIKGAPEVIAEMCEHALGPDDDGESIELDRQAIDQANSEMASGGLRVLAMAIGRGDQAAEAIQSDQPSGMTFVGMQGLHDPARGEATEAVDQCLSSGIRVYMVTGDHAATASAIAKQVHLDRLPAYTDAQAGSSPGDGPGHATSGEESPRGSEAGAESGSAEAVTGQEMEAMSDQQLDELLPRRHVFARVQPAHKVRIVERLKARDQIVAVTGDGVNDAPALKSAHLGAAMGRTGTDVAKEASDMVITDDNFASIYAAVKEGRTAFRNIRMATFFLLSTGAADVLIILTALLAGWPLPLLPAQILWCNVVTNGIADVALGFEPGEKALYQRPPRPVSEGVLNGRLIERLVLVGIWLAAGTLGVFYWVWQHVGDLELARVSALTTLVLFQKVHVFNCRSEDVSIFRKSLLTNKVLLLGVSASLIVHIAALHLPWTQQLLSFRGLPAAVWGVATAVAATAIVVNELHKWLRPR